MQFGRTGGCGRKDVRKVFHENEHVEATCTFLFADHFGTFCVLPFLSGFLVVMNSGFVRQAASYCISELAARVAGPLTNRRVRSLKR